MRIAHVITRLIVGGAQENTVASVLGLRKKSGLEVRLLSGPALGPEGSMEEALQESPGLLTVVPELVRPVHPLKDWLAFQKLTSWFREYQPDIVHTHSGKAGVLGRLAAARAKVQIIVHTIHGPSFGAFQGPLSNTAFRAAERYAARVTTHFVVVANAMKDLYLAAGIGEKERYTRVFSGFHLGPFLSASNDLKLRASYGLAPDDLVVGKIARLFKLKGHDDLFEIAPSLVKECPKLKFLLVGGGEWRHRFESKARLLGMQDRFVFTGLVQPEAIPSLVGIMDILVHLSFREGLPRALPQALAAAKPVVAYDCDGAKEVCLEDETGFLVPLGDKSVLTRRLLRLTQDGALRERFGNRGREFVRQRFGVEQMVDALQSVYLRLRDARGGRLTSETAKTGA